MTETKRSRPGGRSARVRAIVADAVDTLLAERDAADISMADIARVAGVAATSLYRRWGDLPSLLMDVAVDRLAARSPLPDTGTLAGDLTRWASTIVRDLKNGSQFYRILIATAPRHGEASAGRSAALIRRLHDIEELRARARARGETVPDATDIMDQLLAPIYWRVLVGIPMNRDFPRRLVERLLRRSTG